MNRLLSKLLIGMGTVCVVALVGQFSGCNSSMSIEECYDIYGADYYYYCDNYYYDPYYPSYGYYPVYYSTLASDTYGQADPTQAEKAPEPIVNVEHMAYIAKTGKPSKTDLSPADFEAHYPCGKGEEALTVCADPSAPADVSDRILIMFKTKNAVPVADPVNHFVLGFAFDADNADENNFVPAEAEAGDYFGHTDRWYKITYTPPGNWTLEVFDASTGTPVAAESHARFVIQENVVAIVIPAGEFAVKYPNARISLFRHTGDYGLGDDNDWSGLVYPKPGEPLIKPEPDSAD